MECNQVCAVSRKRYKLSVSRVESECTFESAFPLIDRDHTRTWVEQSESDGFIAIINMPTLVYLWLS